MAIDSVQVTLPRQGPHPQQRQRLCCKAPKHEAAKKGRAEKFREEKPRKIRRELRC